MSFFLAQLSASQNLRVASWESAQIYPLFTDPSESISYPGLGSIPGPFLRHNYQPFRIYGCYHRNQPSFIRYSPMCLRVAPTLTSGAFQILFFGTTISQSESMGGIIGISPTLALFTNMSEGSSYPALGGIPGPFLWHNCQLVRIYG